MPLDFEDYFSCEVRTEENYKRLSLPEKINLTMINWMAIVHLYQEPEVNSEVQDLLGVAKRSFKKFFKAQSENWPAEKLEKVMGDCNKVANDINSMYT